MSPILVCPSAEALALAGLQRPSHVIGLGSPGEEIPAAPADAILTLAFHDIDRPRDGLCAPDAKDVAALLAFGRTWRGEHPLLVHCRMGISRSTATAFALACLHRPDVPERTLAEALRSASPCATPNALIVALADAQLGRRGRMSEAIAAIGRGADYAPYRSFALALAAV